MLSSSAVYLTLHGYLHHDEMTCAMEVPFLPTKKRTDTWKDDG